MNRFPIILRIGLSASVCIAGLSICLSDFSRAQPAKEIGIDDPVLTDTASCVTCHNSTGAGEVHPFASKYRSDEYILLSEGNTWKRDDPHSLAHAVLKGKLGSRMGEHLHYDVTASAACLSCHATDRKPVPASDAAASPSNRFDVSSGVGCAACHGTDKTWQGKHFQGKDGKLAWRGFAVEQKKADGLRDLRNPIIKAQICASCHVGNPAEGKIITHDMYAAGHPPLPPFELSALLAGEPPHWAHPTDAKLKGYFGSKAVAALSEKERWERFHFHPVVGEANGESSVARTHAAGAVAALRAEAALIAHEAKNAIREKDGIDFARFDCYACHHDLKVPGDRQKRGGKGPPGRPTLRASIGHSAELVALHAHDVKAGGLDTIADKFPDKWEALRKAATDRPFGDPEKVEAAATEMMCWCDEFLRVQGACTVPLYPKPQAVRLMESIAEAAGQDDVANPEWAAVLTWTYLNLAREIKAERTGGAAEKLSAHVPLVLRSGPFRTAETPSEPTAVDFGRRLKRVNEFKADPFREAFRNLHAEK